MTLDQIKAETLRLEIRAAVAQDAFSARRAREEKLWCEHNGLSAPLSASRYRAMNRVVDFAMSRSKEAEELTAAMKALRENRWKSVRVQMGYAS